MQPPQLEDDVEDVHRFRRHVEGVEVIAEFPAAAQMFLRSGKAVWDFAPSSQTHEKVELVHEIEDDVDASVFTDFHLVETKRVTF